MNNQEQDSNYWKWGIFYYNPQNKNALVAKRNPKMGFTLNFANPRSIIILIGFIAFAVSIVTLVNLTK